MDVPAKHGRDRLVTVFLADAQSATLIWVVAAIGVAALIAAAIIAWASHRSRRPPPPPPSRTNGFAFEAPPRSTSPTPFRPPHPGEHDEESSTPQSAEALEPAPPPVSPPPLPPPPEWMDLWAGPRDSPAGPPPAGGPAVERPEQVVSVPDAEPTGPEPPPPPPRVPSPAPSAFVPPTTLRPGQDVTAPTPLVTIDERMAGFLGPVPTGSDDVNLRGILRWLLFETDADAVSFLQVTPAGEHLYIEPRALPDPSVADLARRAREAMLAGGPGERAMGDASSARWLGAGGSKLLLLTGVSAVTAAEPIRFARFAIEWLAGSSTGEQAQPAEDVARAAAGVAWAEMGADGRLRVLPSAQQQERPSVDALSQLLPGQPVSWITDAPTEGERRARLVDVRLSDVAGTPTAEVRLAWEGAELRGIGHGHRTLVGRHLAAARGAIDALKPLVHGLMHVENLQISTLQSDTEVVLVSVLVGDERLVGATLVTPDDEERSGAKAVLDAMNRRLTQLAGQSGQI